jgi:hypothetical protein
VRLVPLHGQHIVPAAATDEVLRVRPLGMHGIGCDYDTGEVDAVEKRCEHADFRSSSRHVDLPEHDAASSAASRCRPGVPATLDPRTVLPFIAPCVSDMTVSYYLGQWRK